MKPENIKKLAVVGDQLDKKGENEAAKQADQTLQKVAQETDRFEVQEKDLAGHWKQSRLYEFEETALRHFREDTLDGLVVRVIDRKTAKIIAE